MLPIMNIFGIVRMYSFGVFLFIAFISGLFVFWRKGREEHYDEGLLLDGAITASFWAFIGARAGFIMMNWASFGFDPMKWFSLFAYPGFIGIFGILAGGVALILFSRKQKWDTYEILDFATLGLSLGLVFLCLGLFFNGSGFGNATTLPVGMQFPGVFDRRHPVQVYEMALFLIVFIVLMKLELEYRTFLWYRAKKRSAQSGFLFSCFLAAYGVISLCLLLFRPAQFVFLKLSMDIFVFSLIIVVGIGILYIRSGRELPAFRSKKK